MQRNDASILFFALLAVLCQVFVVATALWGAAALAKPSVRPGFRTYVDSLRPLAAPFAFAVALTTMLGSLWMSEVKHFAPCHLCWIQRGLLYPQVLWTLILWIKPDWKIIRWLAALMLVIDLPVSIYHYLLEWYPTIETSVCSLKTPCYLVWFREFHYLTMPFMALTSALTVLTLLTIADRRNATTRIDTQETN